MKQHFYQRQEICVSCKEVDLLESGPAEKDEIELSAKLCQKCADEVKEKSKKITDNPRSYFFVESSE